MPFVTPDRRAVTPGREGRFPGFDVLADVDFWDEVTAGVVLARLDPPPDFSFFDPLEQATAGSLFDQLLGQHDEPKVPVLQLVDRRLALDETDGWLYEDMPEDRDAWRRTLAALEADAHRHFGRSFHELTGERQGSLLQRIQDAEAWNGMTASHVWSLWTRYVCAAFYSHPWAWNEIGFGGPAYPRGYRTLGVDGREPWEVAERDSHDPVPWAERVETATKAHQRIVGPRTDRR